MDLGDWDDLTFNVAAEGAAGKRVTFRARALPGLGRDLEAAWTTLRQELLAVKALAGYELVQDGEDLTVSRSTRTIHATLRLKSTSPAPARKG